MVSEMSQIVAEFPQIYLVRKLFHSYRLPKGNSGAAFAHVCSAQPPSRAAVLARKKFGFASIMPAAGAGFFAVAAALVLRDQNRAPVASGYIRMTSYCSWG
jgi:hypothetical protein